MPEHLPLKASNWLANQSRAIPFWEFRTLRSASSYNRGPTTGSGLKFFLPFYLKNAVERKFRSFTQGSLVPCDPMNVSVEEEANILDIEGSYALHPPLPEDRDHCARRVKSIKKDASGGSIVLDNGEVIKFDILVLATGSIWEGPLHLPNEKEEIDKALKRERDELANEECCVEYAGEIKDIYPDTEVAIVHGDSKLVNAAYPDKFCDKAADNVRARGVKLVLGEYIDNTETKDSVVTCRSGKTIPVDLIPTRGGRLNTALFYALGEGTLTPTGHVKVNKHLQLPAYSDIFALGDIVDIKEQKQAAKVAGHAAVIADNILLALGERKGALKEYNGSSEMIVITNGKDGDVTYFGFLWGLLFGNWVTKTLESKTLLVPMGRSAIGLKD
ncbi:hypothetical protein BDQ17DRAFT_1331122 [Cyathus striatus]|nr:hypothetical protein BDQ17DRAFT_1331122 [Cyathus striatus]